MLLLTNQNHVLPFPIPETIINPNDLIGWCVTKDFRDEGAGVHNGAIAKCEFEGDGGLHWFDVFYAGDDDEESFDSNDIGQALIVGTLDLDAGELGAGLIHRYGYMGMGMGMVWYGVGVGVSVWVWVWVSVSVSRDARRDAPAPNIRFGLQLYPRAVQRAILGRVKNLRGVEWWS